MSSTEAANILFTVQYVEIPEWNTLIDDKAVNVVDIEYLVEPLCVVRAPLFTRPQ